MEWLAAGGLLASGLAIQLADPLLRVRQTLAETVEVLDCHVATSKGPEPLPWTMVSRVREGLAEAFIALGRVSRLATDLAMLTAVTPASPTSIEQVDVNQVVERAVDLARARFRDGDVYLDLGSVPPARGDAARLSQAVAHLLVQRRRPRQDLGRRGRCGDRRDRPRQQHDAVPAHRRESRGRSGRLAGARAGDRQDQVEEGLAARLVSRDTCRTSQSAHT